MLLTKMRLPKISSMRYNASMAKQKRTRNPFYFLLVPVGVAFVVTAFSFGIMAFQQSSPGSYSLDGKVGLMPMMDRHGLTILGVEVALIALFSCGAIATDEYWQRRDAKSTEATNEPDSTTNAATPDRPGNSNSPATSNPEPAET